MNPKPYIFNKIANESQILRIRFSEKDYAFADTTHNECYLITEKYAWDLLESGLFTKNLAYSGAGSYSVWNRKD